MMILKKKFKFIFLLYFLFSISSLILGKDQISLAYYLQSKYLGKIIEYQHEIDNFKQSEIIEIVFTKTGYEALLENKERVIFQFYLSLNPNLSLTRKNKENLNQQLLKSTQFVNAAMAQIGNDQADTSSISQYYSSTANDYNDNQNDYFDSLEEIIYTESQTNKSQTGKAFATTTGIYLENGFPIEIRFLKKKNAN